MNKMRLHRHPAYWMFNETNNGQQSQVPSTNIVENDNNFKVEVAAPGFSKKEISIDLEKDMLIVSSTREFEKQEEEVNYTRKEFGYTNFSRSFTLPETIDKENVKAEFKNGVLSITLPKKEEVKLKKQIAIA